jgi:hypothetical protein
LPEEKVSGGKTRFASTNLGGSTEDGKTVQTDERISRPPFASWDVVVGRSSMGVSWFISLERKIPGFNELDVDGKLAMRSSDVLDEIAKKLAVTPLSEFFDVSLDEMADVFGEEAIEGLEPKEVRWFAASEGLKTTEALLKHVQTDPQSVPRADGVLQDLRDFEKILKRAETEGVRWHLSAC